MGWIISFIFLIVGLFNDAEMSVKLAMLAISGLFAISGAISDVANKLNK